MPTVETVHGPVDAAALGLTLVHEHVRARDEATAANWPTRYDEKAELAAAIAAVEAAAQRGVRTIVEPTAMLNGRDVGFVRRVSDATGVEMVACTGIYTYDHLPQYFATRDADQIAEHFVEDVERGIQGTDIKAAFIKVAADHPGITPNVDKLHRAAARASLQTGAPIMAHSAPAAGTGPLQVAIFEEEGVDPAKVHLAHCGGHRRRRLHRGPDRPRGSRSAWTATAWRSSCPTTSATRRPPSCCAAATRAGSCSRRTTARRWTGSRPRPPRRCSPTRRSWMAGA